jgi:hypothetical protein
LKKGKGSKSSPSKIVACSISRKPHNLTRNQMSQRLRSRN